MSKKHQYSNLEILRLWKSAKGEMTRAEFSQSLGIPENTINSKITRARIELKAGRYASPPGDYGEGGGDDSPPGVHFVHEGNTMELDSKTTRIKTLDDLIRECNIDLEIWKIERWVINKWEVGAKTAYRRLVWEDGNIIDGEIDDPGVLTVEPLFQVKAWLVKRNPEPIEPAVGSIIINLPRPKAGHALPARGNGLTRALVIPDIQTGFRKHLHTGALDPFHDRAALDVAVQIAAAGFDRVVFLGDIMDLAEWTDKFIRTPDFYFSSQAAIVEAAWWLAQFRLALPGAQMDVIEGNHELRITQSLALHLSAAYHLKPANEIKMPPALSIPRLLGFADLGINWVEGYPDSSVWLTDDLRCTHGYIARGNPGDTAKAVVADSGESVVFGHIHRVERATRTRYGRHDSSFITALSPGCLCRLDGVVPGHTKGQDWQQGVGVAYYNQTGFHSLEAIPIVEGMAVFEGRLYQAQPRLDQLRSDTNWSF